LIKSRTRGAWNSSLQARAKAELERLGSTSGCDEPLADFVHRISPTFAPPLHLAPLIAELERSEREPVRVLVSVPPRHGKTETILHAFAWWLRRNPRITCGYTSYATDFAWSKSGVAREYAKRAGVQLRIDANAKSEWRTTAGGGLLATGVGGPLTGHGVDRLVIDDAHKNRREAESAVLRSHILEWATSTAFTRLEPGGSVFVVHTRWHPSDLIGSLQKQAGVPWRVIDLPAINGEGAALWPERWPAEALQQRRLEVGEYDWASLFQGQPRPRGGAVFHDAHLYAELPKRLRVTIGLDFAYTAKTSADYSAAVVLGRDMDSDAKAPVFYILDALREQDEPEVFAGKLAALSKRHSGAPMHAYIGGTERANIALLSKFGVRVHAKPAVADKFVRAQPVAAAWNRGAVKLPEGGSLKIDALASECASFTGLNDPHDDLVDALAAAYDANAVGSLKADSKYDAHLPNFSVG
jgi:predicted phage terminase large subunit-like protein